MGINYFTNTYCSSFTFMKEGELMSMVIKNNKFEINNEKWEIIETSQEKMCEEYNEEFKNDGNFYNGITCPITKKILLYEDLDSQQKKKTLYHELMHCYLFTYISFNNIDFCIDDFCDISANSHDIIHKIVEDYFKDKVK